ncbi:uncharacterized protein LOC127277388 [Leptopilina boulardi]|uniref:uncharacterized protein LOC127277388 n=1 Tax=Leptopilina boulardi TaxID=63433 RepID=UPI0021F57B7A|nr:uncharacterized protein LOC127277388 [Leptopilina boulardi]
MILQPSILLINLLIILSINAEPLVKISQGQLRGNIETARYGTRYSAFLGIPYAKPPVGGRRFKNPEPAASWTGVRSAHAFGNPCPQNDNGRIFGKDDCLYLNVYTPRLEFNNPKPTDKLLPVMVWIHGGSFLIGTGNMYGAQYLLEKDIILVTLNYRLGILGFLTTGNSIAPGNFGMKDQVEALKWVQKNIKSFGGDPKKVTLFGESAGGIAVNLHAISKASNGLFQKYIIQSGTVLGPGGYQQPQDFEVHVKELARKFNCPDSSQRLIVNCLRRVNSNELAKASSGLDALVKTGHFIWVPTIESDTPDAFLTEIPLDSVDNNKTKDLPFMSGTVADEGLSFTAPAFSNFFVYLAFRFNVRTILNYIAKFYDQNPDRLFSAMNAFYFDNRYYITLLPDDYLRIMTKYFSDAAFFYPEIRLLEKVTPQIKNKNYFYNFGYRGGLSLTGIGGDKRDYGVSHGDDILYLFSLNYFTIQTTNANFTGDDEKVSRILVDFWTTFATDGKPTSTELPNPNVWQPYSPTTSAHIQIGKINDNKDPTVSMSNRYYTQRINFWRKNKQYSMNTLLLINLLWILSISAEPLVKISHGQLRGNTQTTRYGKSYSAFLGIPYAKPPIADRRFKNPEPAENWNGIRSAHSFENACPQNDNGKIFGKDDCLYLNVYTPRLEFNNPKSTDKLIPVMVWIHGGSFLTGTGNMYGAQYLLEKNIILVTFNYRLGILGFLTTGDSVAQGNFGMKDQVEALKWVQKNIKSFGGDPKKVTLFGQSAGGASVNLHSISRASNDLFQKYIIQSGTILGPGGYQDQKDFQVHVKELARKFNCPVRSSQVIIDCLRKIDSNDLVKASTIDETIKYGHSLWTPTIESDTPDAFLTEIPLNSIDNNQMKDLPFMSGNCADEGLSLKGPGLSNFLLYLFFRLNFRTSINYVAKYYKQDAEKLFTAMNKFYFNNRFYITILPNEFLNIISKFLSDSSFFYPEIRLLEKVTPRMKNNNYLYNFGYRGTLNMAAIGGIKDNTGVSHGDDILYLFPITSVTFVTTNANFTGNDEKISRIMVDFWTSFATNGKPTSNELPNSNLWQPYSSITNAHIQIGNINNNKDPTMSMSNSYYTERINFWRKNAPI